MINWIKIKSALVSTVLAGILAGAIYILGVGDVFNLDIKAFVNVISMALLSGIVSLIKSSLTTDAGNFAGAVKVTETHD